MDFEDFKEQFTEDVGKALYDRGIDAVATTNTVEKMNESSGAKGYFHLEEKGDKKTKYLVPTHKGEMLIAVIPEAIQSASMTAEWEQKLLEVEKESYSADQFMDEIESMVKELVDTYEIVQDAEVLMKPAYAPLGKCPHCGADVIEKTKGFFCENKDCKFALWKDNRFFDSLSKKLTKQVAEQLLSRGRAKLKKCRSVKTGKTYDTTVVLSVSDNGAPQFSLDFSKGAK